MSLTWSIFSSWFVLTTHFIISLHWLTTQFAFNCRVVSCCEISLLYNNVLVDCLWLDQFFRLDSSWRHISSSHSIDWQHSLHSIVELSHAVKYLCCTIMFLLIVSDLINFLSWLIFIQFCKWQCLFVSAWLLLYIYWLNIFFLSLYIYHILFLGHY